MKKITVVFEVSILILAFVLFIFGICSCTSVDDEDVSLITSELSTDCYIGTNQVLTKRALSTRFDNGAYFYIRVDNRIPGSGSYPVKYYYPKNRSNLSVRENYNYGTLILNYPNWNFQGNMQYVYDTSGKEVLKTIKSAPDWKELLRKSNVKLNTDTLKVLWYITKYEDNFWHVDGILTGIHTKDVSECIEVDKTKENKKDTITPKDSVSGNVEIDIHHQEHKSWDEIKTSVHIRALVDSVKISIPMTNVCEADDMAIRYFEYFEPINNTYAQVKIEHIASSINIIIKVNNINSLIEQGDGLTVELHNYVIDLSNNEIWNYISKATVKTYRDININLHISDFRGSQLSK